MMGFRRRRPERAALRRHRAVAGPEALEVRQLLAANSINPYLIPQGILAPTFPPHPTPVITWDHPIGTGPRQLSFLDNTGKVLTGKDRQGNEWQIVVHGPGSVIVTDATPNDGALDDDIDTIQLVGTDPNSTYVTGQTTASARVVTTGPLPATDPTITYVTGQPPNPMQQITAGTVRFNRLISLDGVNHIELNGFNLSRTVAPVPGTLNNLGPEIYLPGGVRYLSFNNIEAPIDRAFADQPIEIVIGRPDAPLPYQPTIRIASIFNTVYDSRLRINPNGNPPTDPTVSIIVNGQLQGLEMVSATNAPVMGGQQYVYPTVGTTGRTAVRALGIGTFKALGTVRNTTLSRSPQPFSSGLSGLNRLDRLSVGGIADGLRVDVSRGDIGQIKLRRGLGDPTGALSDNRTAPSGARTGTIYLGQPFPQFGNPSFGIDGGLIVARRIGTVTAGPAYDFLQTGQDPDYRQIRSTRSTTYYPRAGRALTNAAVLTGFGIRRVDIVGDAQNSEIKAGFHFPSFVSGLEPVRVPSSIGRVRWRGNLISSVASATYRTGPDLSYGQADDVAGPGRIAGSLQQGALYSNNRATVLANGGVGFYARRKDGYLPPPQRPRWIRGVNIGY